MEFRVNTAYDDSKESLDELVQVISYVPPRTGVVEKGGSLSGLILHEYGFGPDDGIPKTYNLFEKTILWLNGVSKPEDIQPGQVLIPSVPRRALTKPNTHKGINMVPKIIDFLNTFIESLSEAKKRRIESVGEVSGVKAVLPETITRGIPDTQIMGTPRVLDEKRRASQSAVLSVSFKQDQVRSLFNDKTFARVARVVNFPMDVQLATIGTHKSSHEAGQLLSDTEKALILARVNNGKPVTLLILDTGWPSDPSDFHAKAMKHLYEVLDSVWKYLRLKPPKRKTPEYQRPSNKHCERVLDALAEFRRLDSAGKIRIVFVPLTREQGAEGLLEEIIQLNELIWLMGPRLGLDTPAKSDVTKQQDFARKTVKQLPDIWPADQKAVRTDKEVLEAILGVANVYAGLSGRAIIVNESWTVPAFQYRVDYPQSFMGAVVSATGNDKQNINAIARQFAHRAMDSKDTVAVMNMSRDGVLQCDSAYIDAQYLPQQMSSVGYDGTVDKECYTSYSAPRVAWLLALAEATRTREVDSKRWIAWFGSLLSRLHPKPNQLQDLRLDVSTLLSPEEQEPKGAKQ